VIALSTSACSSTTSESKPSSGKNELLVQPTPTCSTEEFSGGSDWIKGQLKAFSERNPEKAYSYASETFRMNNSLTSFSTIIAAQYSMLLDIKDFKILSCDKSDPFFTYGLKLIDNGDVSYEMEYVLSYSNKKWGVEGASVTERINN
jgi:hypothetical protein